METVVETAGGSGPDFRAVARGTGPLLSLRAAFLLLGEAASLGGCWAGPPSSSASLGEVALRRDQIGFGERAVSRAFAGARRPDD